MRIKILKAASAPLAVVFRQGPPRQTQQLLWNLDTDELVPGQWIKAYLTISDCDLSPDGRYLLGVFQDDRFKRQERAVDGGLKQALPYWTALSKPPYFTALAIWFHQAPYDHKGGYWHNASELRVSMPDRDWDRGKFLCAPPFDVRHETNPRRRSVTALQMVRSGWARRSDDAPSAKAPSTWVKAGDRVTLRRRVRLVLDDVWAVELGQNRTIDDIQPSFLEFDSRGRVIFAQDGRLFAWENCPQGSPKLIADLTSNRFEPAPAPNDYFS
ncbi:MAG TPA: hypothetical protein VG944_04030 [Fimbriimonas sp.]|nr:hypothetical protein [Fimbriimonas sp.]